MNTTTQPPSASDSLNDEECAYQERYNFVVQNLAANDMRVAGWMKNVITLHDFKRAFLQALGTEKPYD